MAITRTLRASPSGPKIFGSAVIGAPLSTEFYVDPTTGVLHANQNGSIGAPFATLVQACAAIVALGLAPGSGVSVQCIGDVYTEVITLPPGLVVVFQGRSIATQWNVSALLSSSLTSICIFQDIDWISGVVTLAGSGTLGLLFTNEGLNNAPPVDASGVSGSSIVLDENTSRPPAEVPLINEVSQYTMIGTCQVLGGTIDCVVLEAFGSLFTDTIINSETSVSLSNVQFAGASASITTPSLSADAVSAYQFIHGPGSPGVFGTLPAITMASQFPEFQSLQAVPASLSAVVAGVFQASTEVLIGFAQSSHVPAAGESMTIDVLATDPANANVSLLISTLVLNAASCSVPGTVLPLVLKPDTPISKGSRITVQRTYVAGGGPAMTSTAVTLMVV